MPESSGHRKSRKRVAQICPAKKQNLTVLPSADGISEDWGKIPVLWCRNIWEMISVPEGEIVNQIFDDIDIFH